VPPGVLERCVAASCASGRLREYWRHGALVDGQPRALLQLAWSAAGEGRIEVEVRGAGKAPDLWAKMSELTAVVRGVMREYAGVHYREDLVCPSCRAAGRFAEEPWSKPTVWDMDEVWVRQRKYHMRKGPQGGQRFVLQCDQCAEQVELAVLSPEAAGAAGGPGGPGGPKAAAAVWKPGSDMIKPARLPPPRDGFASIPRPKREFAAFLLHDPGADEHGRDNAERVRLAAEALEGRVQCKVQLADGSKTNVDAIENSACVLLFITQGYIARASGDGPQGKGDVVKFELEYALKRKGVDQMIAVVMEAPCRDPRDWGGVVGERCGGVSYVDLLSDDLPSPSLPFPPLPSPPPTFSHLLRYVDLLSDDPAKWEEGISQVADEISALTDGQKVKKVQRSASSKKPRPPSAGTPPTTPSASAPANGASAERLSSVGKVFTSSSADKDEEQLMKYLKRGSEAVKPTKVSLADGISALIKDARVALSPAQRDAALAFCTERGLAAVADIVEQEHVDAFLVVLDLPPRPAKKLRSALAGQFETHAPWWSRSWRQIKGGAQEIAKETKRIQALLPTR
jgi:hypothetical protein